MLLLGIETSCDETAAALVEGSDGPVGIIRAHIVHSQIAEHRPFGGVVPEVAARAHLDRLDGVIRAVLADDRTDLGALDGIAATAGPGLIGGVMVGVTTAKALALASGRPFVAVNHLEAHALTARLVADVAFPYLLLLISGGHCQLLIVEAVGRYSRLGTTIDDAIGEAFDKTAKLLDLGYPGGPAVERAARDGNPLRFGLPTPMVGRANCDFSFSGLKTAVRLAAEAAVRTLPTDRSWQADLAAAFQRAVSATLADRTRRAAAIFRHRHPDGRYLVAAGGVASNQAIRQALGGVADDVGLDLLVPPPALCTDNAAMVGWAGLERLRLGMTDDLDFPARPRWPLDPGAGPAQFAGARA